MVLAGGLPYGGCLMDWFTTCLNLLSSSLPYCLGCFGGAGSLCFPQIALESLLLPFASFCFLSVRCCSLWFPLDPLGSFGFPCGSSGSFCFLSALPPQCSPPSGRKFETMQSYRHLGSQLVSLRRIVGKFARAPTANRRTHTNQTWPLRF